MIKINLAPITVPNEASSPILNHFRSYLSQIEQREKERVYRLASRTPKAEDYAKYGVRIQQRAQLIVRAAESSAKSLKAMAAELEVPKARLRRWLSRFTEHGTLGLRTRAPKTRRTCLTEDRLLELDRLLQLDVSTVPNEPKYAHLKDKLCFAVTRWTGKALALCLGVSEATISRYLKRTGRSLTASIDDSFCASTDPDFGPKLTAIAEILQRPLNDDEVVYCVDEKTCISAICDDYAFNNVGQVVKGCRWTRNGTTHLLAALDFGSGKLASFKFSETKTRKDFMAFVTQLVELPESQGKRVYIVLDNLLTHKSFGAEWYNAHPNVSFLFTPTCCSWANPIESFFGIFEKGCLRVRQWSSVEEIHERACCFFEAYNKQARPFHFSLDVERYLAQRKHNLYNLNKVLAFELSASRARSSKLASTFIAALTNAAETIYKLAHPLAKAKEVRFYLKDVETKLSMSVSDNDDNVSS